MILRQFSVLGLLALSGLLAIPVTVQAQDIRDIIRSELACALLDPVFADMPVAPLYRLSGSACEATTPDSSTINYFSDDTCSDGVNFSHTDLVDHCALLLDSVELGEGAGLVEGSWTMPPGARFDVGALSLDGVQQPYMQRTIYRQLTNEAGVCDLEMRIYASHPTIKNQKPLIAFHGGSWSGRGFGFFGLELTVAHYVNQGFVVFAPFYRLLDDKEGSAACHNATIDNIVDDANAALAWVQREAPRFGASGKPVTFGQSAGAHLAASLALYSADEISGAVLMYPPTDFTDFALRAISGVYDNEQGLSILRRVIQLQEDADFSSINPNASPVPENSFPQRIADDRLSHAPIFMVHGLEDDLVEARQSLRLCEAIAGEALTPTDSQSIAITGLRESRACGDDSVLHLIREGQHALDVCITGNLIPTDLCPSGSEASRLEVAAAINEASQFANDVANVVSDDVNNPQEQETGSGATSVLAFILSCLMMIRAWLNRRRQLA